MKWFPGRGNWDPKWNTRKNFSIFNNFNFGANFNRKFLSGKKSLPFAIAFLFIAGITAFVKFIISFIYKNENEVNSPKIPPSLTPHKRHTPIPPENKDIAYEKTPARDYYVGNDITARFGVTSDMLKEALIAGDKKLILIKSFGKIIKNNDVKKNVEHICGAVKKILDHVEKRPEDLKLIRQFLNYQLAATINILQRYIDLININLTSSEIVTSLKRAETILDTIEKAFNKQVIKLKSHAVMDLNTEMDVLEKTLKMEGY